MDLSSSSSPTTSSSSDAIDFDAELAAHCLIAMSNSHSRFTPQQNYTGYHQEQHQHASTPYFDTIDQKIINSSSVIPSCMKRSNHPSGGSAGDRQSPVSSSTENSSPSLILNTSIHPFMNYQHASRGATCGSSPSPSSIIIGMIPSESNLSLMPVDLSSGSSHHNYSMRSNNNHNKIHQQEKSTSRRVLFDSSSSFSHQHQKNSTGVSSSIESSSASPSSNSSNILSTGIETSGSSSESLFMIARILADLNTIQQDDPSSIHITNSHPAPHNDNFVSNIMTSPQIISTTSKNDKTKGKNTTKSRGGSAAQNNLMRGGKLQKTSSSSTPPINNCQILMNTDVHQDNRNSPGVNHVIISSTPVDHKKSPCSTTAAAAGVTRHVCSYPGCQKVYGQSSNDVYVDFADINWCHFFFSLSPPPFFFFWTCKTWWHDTYILIVMISRKILTSQESFSESYRYESVSFPFFLVFRWMKTCIQLMSLCFVWVVHLCPFVNATLTLFSFLFSLFRSFFLSLFLNEHLMHSYLSVINF